MKNQRPRNGETGVSAWAGFALAFGLSLGLGMPAAQDARAEKVGVAAAVNPDAYYGAGGTQKQLRIGKSIFYNERISTDANGVVQVLLVDGSTFTVGKNSDVVIDRFVYNPRKNTGEIVTTFSKGSMRFIGGKISKNPGGVRVNTPDGSLAIRGGMFQGNIGSGGSIFSFLYGEELTFTGRNGRTQTVYQPGYTLDLSTGTPNIRPTTPADIQLLMASLTNSNTQTGSVQTDPPAPPQRLAETLSLQQLIADATASRIDGELFEQLQALQQPQGEINSTIGGYGAAFVLSNGNYDPDVGASTSASDFKFNQNKGTVSLTLRDVGGEGSVSRGVFEFDTTGGQSFNLESATYYNNNGQAYETLSATGSMTVEPDAICDQCTFMEWGAVNATVTYLESVEDIYGTTDNINGWWISADITDAADLPQMGNATYSGKAVGYIAETGNPTYYTGRGDLDMSWNFAKRSGDLSITNFNAPSNPNLPTINVSGKMTMPGSLNRFKGSLASTDQNGFSGAAFGSFARHGNDPAAGVVGNWGVSNSNYKATGVFGGVRR